MPLSGKKKKGKRKKKVAEEARERKRLDKWDTKAMKFIVSLDMYSRLIQKTLSWYEDNEKLVKRYFRTIPCSFPISLLESYINANLPETDTTEIDNDDDSGDVSTPSSGIYTIYSAFSKGLIDLGAPYTEIEMHIFSRIIQQATSVFPPEEDNEEEGKGENEKPPAKSSRIEPSKSTSGDPETPAEAPTISTNPELFQDLIVKVSGALKVLQAEEKYTWEILTANTPVMTKTKERIPWVKAIIEKRKAAEAKKKKKKKKKKKRPKSTQGPVYERCTTCNIIIQDPYPGPLASQFGYVKVNCRLASRDGYPRHPMHVIVNAQAHWPLAQIATSVIEQTDLATADIFLYVSPPNMPGLDASTNLPLAHDLSIQDLGISGGPRLNPTELTIYYDFGLPLIARQCPLLNADTLYEYYPLRQYQQQQREYQMDFAKVHHDLGSRHQQDLNESGSESESDDDDDDDNSDEEYEDQSPDDDGNGGKESST